MADDFGAACEKPFAERRFDEKLKCLKLDKKGNFQVSFGLDLREQFIYQRNEQWGALSPARLDSNGFGWHRAMMHIDLKLTSYFRVFVQPQSDFVWSRKGGVREPIDENRFDIHQLVAEARLPLEKSVLSLRAGRMEMVLANGRLLANRDLPNVRLVFDAIQAGWQGKNLGVRAFIGRPVDNRQGVLDDTSNTSKLLWGAYAIGKAPIIGGTATLYYLGHHNKGAILGRSSGVDDRHTIGLHYQRASKSEGKSFLPRLGWELEAAYQMGTFRTNNIQAYMATADAHYAYTLGPIKGRIGFGAYIGSGDRDSTDATAGTFNSLYARPLFGLPVFMGSMNLVSLNPYLSVTPIAPLELLLGVFPQWRYSDQDGMYNPPGSLVRLGSTGWTERRYGTLYSFTAKYTVNRNLDITAQAAHYTAGAFAKEGFAGKAVNFLSLMVLFRL